MFDFKNSVITKVFNPLNITKSSMIEFNIGDLRNTGLYSFAAIVEFNMEQTSYSRYVIYSKSENTEFVFEVMPGNNGQLETYLYRLVEEIPFSEDFLEVVGQRYLTTPDGVEYERLIMPEYEERIDGVYGQVKVFDVETGKIDKEYAVKTWEYQRENEGETELLSIEMSQENGLFKIFIGEPIEDIFYKFYQTSK